MRFSLKKAKGKHLRRTSRARAIDNARRNKHIIRRNQRSRLHLWFAHPGRYDIIGIDYPHKRRRRIAHLKHHRPTSSRTPFSLFVRRHSRNRRINRRMNTGMQLFNFKKLMQKHEVPHDVFDIKSHMDRSLHYSENRRIIEPKLRILSPNQDDKRKLRIWREDAYGIY